ncbi:hypothetical protein L0Z72_06180 [candidate division KSB1 bacterium]|nr:hypothetical protein [candidate division KSB1 bacterium]
MRAKILLILFGLFLFSSFSQAQEKVDLSTINERLIRLEEGQKSINQRFEDVNKRFDDINKRIDDLQVTFNNRFDDVMTLLQIVIAALTIVFVGIFGALFMTWRKFATVEAKVKETFRTDERDRAAFFYEERLRKVENQIKEILELVAR